MTHVPRKGFISTDALLSILPCRTIEICRRARRITNSTVRDASSRSPIRWHVEIVPRLYAGSAARRWSAWTISESDEAGVRETAAVCRQGRFVTASDVAHVSEARRVGLPARAVSQDGSSGAGGGVVCEAEKARDRRV